MTRTKCLCGRMISVGSNPCGVSDTISPSTLSFVLFGVAAAFGVLGSALRSSLVGCGFLLSFGEIRAIAGNAKTASANPDHRIRFRVLDMKSLLVNRV